MKRFLAKWLPIFFGCHCRPDRSFFRKGKQFPICARCTGELIGMLIAPIWWFLLRPPVWLCAVLLMPMVTDGFLQLLTPYESKNGIRCFTGLLFGFGLVMLAFYILSHGFRLGVEFGRNYLLT